MSYDLYLRNPVTKEELTVPGHLMYGGNVMCDYIDGAFIPNSDCRRERIFSDPGCLSHGIDA